MLNYEALSPKIQHAILNDPLTNAVWKKHQAIGNTDNKSFLEDLSEYLLDSKEEYMKNLLTVQRGKTIVLPHELTGEILTRLVEIHDELGLAANNDNIDSDTALINCNEALYKIINEVNRCT